MVKFVSEEKVAVTVADDPNTIYIKPRMDFGTRNRVHGTATHVTTKKGEEATAEFDIGAYQIALLIHNIVGWSGPDFDSVACTHANIEKLEPDDPLLEEALKQINARNTQRAATSPNLTSSLNESASGSTRKTATKPSPEDQ